MDNQDLFLRANKALSEGNYKEFLSCCDKDIIWENVGGKTFHGATELLEYVSSAYEGVTFTTTNTIKDDNFIIEIGELVVKENGVMSRNSYCDVWKFKNGLISEMKSFVIELT